MTGGIDNVREVFASAEDIDLPEDMAGGDPQDPGIGPDDRDYDDPGDSNPPPRTPDEDEPPELQGARFALNDTGNGHRFALYFGRDIIVVPRVGWFVWTGQVWKRDQDVIATRRLAQKVADRIIAEIPHLALEDWMLRELESETQVRAEFDLLMAIEVEDRTAEQKVQLDDLGAKLTWIGKIKERRSKMKSDHRSFAKTTGNKGRIDAMLTEATVELARPLEDLDSDPLAINTEGGVLRFSTHGGPGEGYSRVAEVRLEPHERGQLMTKIMPVRYDPAETAPDCPQFAAYLERIMPDAEMRGFLQRWFGLSMTALTGEQKFAFFYGSGANGKSVLVDLMARMLGDYAATAKIESLTGRNRRGGGDATPDLIPLVGARMVRASEPEEGERLQEGMIKELTGGEPILVRSLHADFVEVQPHFKLTISGNHKPDIRGTDDGIWRRVLLVPFDVQIPKNERDEKLGEKLWAERDGIFAWLVEGLLAYLEGGLQEPSQVLSATEEYRADSDPIGTFLGECCVATGDSGDFVTARDLMDGFNLWLDMKGESMWGSRTVSLKFKSLAGRYRDPGTGKKYIASKMKVTGYRGLKFRDPFLIQFQDAPRNAQGHPVAFTAKKGASD